MKQGLIVILKFLAFLLILPLTIASVLAFQNQILSIPAVQEQWFLWGVVIFLLVYVFLYNFKEVYVFGQSIVGGLFKFFQPLANIAGLIIPIYTILALSVFLIVHVVDVSAKYEGYLLLVLGFSVAMHIVLTALQLYEADSSSIKGEYLFNFGLALVANLFIMSLLLGFAIPEFSFVGFLKTLSGHTASYYTAIYRLLFVSPT